MLDILRAGIVRSDNARQTCGVIHDPVQNAGYASQPLACNILELNRSDEFEDELLGILAFTLNHHHDVSLQLNKALYIVSLLIQRG